VGILHSPRDRKFCLHASLENRTLSGTRKRRKLLSLAIFYHHASSACLCKHSMMGEHGCNRFTLAHTCAHAHRWRMGFVFHNHSSSCLSQIHTYQSAHIYTQTHAHAATWVDPLVILPDKDRQAALPLPWAWQGEHTSLSGLFYTWHKWMTHISTSVLCLHWYMNYPTAQLVSFEQDLNVVCSLIILG